ncbi:glycosyltransferase [Pseudomonas chlororaphis]|uniref:glycosyltransferase n=1 Tax=Pseudomonas chlororaphis TaxID=587753 RepID=UPI00236849FA|nr:glycosyltransferase [Pseudomonas chlororaphis]WDH51674.1 glycosyltransferase [Pseudomonas chlororaphis]
MELCFVVGSMAISGGTYVIIQHASYLRARGHNVTLAVQEPFTTETLAWHDEAPKLRCLPIDEAKKQPFDLVIATWWKTVFELGNFDSRRYGYFVQSIESRFYPISERPLRALVDATYNFPIEYVTEATWIQQHLKDSFGQHADLVRNGIRKDVYSINGPTIEARPAGKQPRVLVEGHFGVSFKNTALGVRLAREAGAKDIWLLTGSPISWIPGISRVFSRVPMVKTAEIYRSCDILIKLSTVEGMFGPPLELFHCGGTAIVFDVSGHDEYILDGSNAIVVKTGNVDGVVKALKQLLTNSEELLRLQDEALKTAEKWPSWPEASVLFENWVEKCMSAPPVNKAKLIDLTTNAFSEYSTAEEDRLSNNPGIVRRHKLSALAAKLPSSFKLRIKQLEAVGEVIFGGRVVR